MTTNFTKTLCSFIQNGKALITWNNKCSDTFDLRAGVPQGAMLSPTLYNIYIAPLPPPIYQESSDIIYADDVTQIIIFPYRSKRDIINRTEQEIARINRFEKEWHHLEAQKNPAEKE